MAKKEVKLVAANKKKDHKIKETEKEYVHLMIGRREFSSTTGKAKFKPYPQIFDPREYKTFLDHPNGMYVKEVLHLPDGCPTPEAYAKEKEEKAKKEKEKIAQAAKK